MSDSSKQTLLVCQAPNCGKEFVDEIDPKLEGNAASLPAALKANRAGWLIVEGKILCPDCAKKTKRLH